MPLVRPVTVHGETVQPLLVNPSGLLVAVYPVMALPPLLAGAVNVTVAWASPAVAAPMVGAPGTVAGVTLLEAVEAAPWPMALVAFTVNV